MTEFGAAPRCNRFVRGVNGTATVLIEVKTRMKNHFEFSFFLWMGASPQTPGIF
jgi:hypothetical protein